MKTVKIGVLVVAVLTASMAMAQLPARQDGVVVKAEQVPGLEGEKIGQLGLMRWSGKEFQPVPFQIDEKTPEGNFIYPEGSKKNPQLLNGKLEAQDELVFMAWDAGALAPEGTRWPESAVKAAELVLTDPESNARAAVYLFAFSGAVPNSGVDYARHLVEDGRNFVKTGRYWFGEPQAKGFFDRLHLVGPDGKVGANMVDRIKGRGHIRTIGGLINMVKGENDTPADLVGWIDGPVRVVHRMEGGIELPLGIKIKLAGGSDNVFYSNYYYTPIFFSLPTGAASLLKGSYMIYTIDFNQKFKGSYFFDAANKTPVPLDGKTEDAEKKLDLTTHHNWYAVTGDKGNMVVRMIIPEQWKGAVTLTTFYVDNEAEADPPESEPGRLQPGLKIGGMFEAPAGKYTYILYYMVSDKKLNWDGVDPWLDILDHPLKVSAKSL